MSKKCNDKDCSSEGALLPEEDFRFIKGGKSRSGICRVCTSRKAKERRRLAHNKRSVQHYVSREDAAKAETKLFNSMNMRW